MKTAAYFILLFLLVADLTYRSVGWYQNRMLELERVEAENERIKATLYYANRYNARLEMIMLDLQYRAEYAKKYGRKR